MSEHDPPRARLRLSACVLSLLVPGAGQLLLGRRRRAALWLGGTLLLTPLAYWLATTPGASRALFLGGILVSTLPPVAAAVDAAAVRTGPPRPRMRARTALYLLLLLAGFLTRGGEHLLLRHVRAQPYRTVSTSMEPTLLAGDHLLVDRSAFPGRHPQRGELVVFDLPTDETIQFVKRVVGLPGDTIRLSGNVLQVNGAPIGEAGYGTRSESLDGRSWTVSVAGGRGPMEQEEIVVPDDCCYVLGDSRNNSRDSRFFGPIPLRLLVGSALRVYWSQDPAGRIRLDRIGLRPD